MSCGKALRMSQGSLWLRHEDINMIPAPTSKPDSVQINQESDITKVVFDLETTGRGFKPEVIQIATKYGDEQFSAYLSPKKHFIPSCITDLTGISMRDGNMFFKGEKVDQEASHPKVALTLFIAFLPDNCVLVGHNTHAFDTRILLLNVRDYDLVQQLCCKVQGFLHTLC